MDYAEKLYGIKPNSSLQEPEEDEDDDNIEASIQKEIEALNTKEPSVGKLFTAVWVDIPCVLFFKTRYPVEPVEFVRKICEDAVAGEPRRSRFVNRLTPMVMMGRATEKGLEEVGRSVLEGVFGVAGENEQKNGDEIEGGFAYAIRPTIRASNTMKRADVIKQVADLVPAKHRVDLTKPDKVILVEIYQTVCGMSVVGSDWESLKRFNLAEIYQPKNPTAVKSETVANEGTSTDATVTNDQPEKSATTKSEIPVADDDVNTEAATKVSSPKEAIPKTT